VVLGAGPGSYTGLRIAAAAAKGIVHALGRELYAHGSLEAMSAGVDAPARPLLPLIGARRGEVFVACHGRDGDDLVELLAPALLSLEEAAAVANEHDALAIGPGAAAGSALLRRAGAAVDAAAGDRAAVGLLRLQARRGEAARVDDAGAWEPVYLRREEQRERGQPIA
jgi:tRNA threonylcarbamoyladenosine biosynthesis protein TsaB